MDIRELLSSAEVILDFPAPDKVALLRELSGRAATALHLSIEKVSSDVLRREELGSTGVGGGVAIPHARIKGLKKPYGILARVKTAVDFSAIDNKPVDLVFLLLLPAAAAGEHLNALAAVARTLRDPGVLGKLRHATDSNGLHRAMTD